jgi:hypothetical protein
MSDVHLPDRKLDILLGEDLYRSILCLKNSLIASSDEEVSKRTS